MAVNASIIKSEQLGKEVKNYGDVYKRQDETGLKRKEIREKRAAEGFSSVSTRLAHAIEATTGIETRVVVPGHIQRGGSPSAYDRVLSTKFGVQAAELIYQNKFGYTVAKQKDRLTQNKLSEIAGKPKPCLLYTSSPTFCSIPSSYPFTNLPR